MTKARTLADLGTVTSSPDELNYSTNVTSDIQSQIDGKASKSGADFTGDVTLDDNNKVKLGTDNDLEIYHSGSHAFIANNTGNVYISSNVDDDDGGNIYLRAKTGEDSIVCNDDSSVQLYHDNSLKFYTESTGATLRKDLWLDGDVNSGTPTLYFAEDYGGYGSLGHSIRYDGSSNFLLFRRSNSNGTHVNVMTMPRDSNKVYFNSDAGSTFAQFDGANAVFLSYNGIVLGNSYAAANTLDDYEEGTWTGTLKGYYSDPTTAVTATGYYTKIGRSVHFGIDFGTIDTTGGNGHMWVSGLPFTSSNYYSVGGVQMDKSGTYPNSAPFNLVSGTIAYINKHVNEGDATAVFHNAGTGRKLRLSNTYITTA